MEIRKATKKDLKDLIDLHINLIKYLKKIKPSRYIINKKIVEKRRKKLMEWLKKKEAIIYVAEDKKIVGYGMGEVIDYPPFIEGKKFGELDEVYVLPEYRGKGIGKKLTNKVIEFLKKKKVDTMEGYVDTKNKLALKTWKEMGFKENLIVITKKL